MSLQMNLQRLLRLLKWTKDVGVGRKTPWRFVQKLKNLESWVSWRDCHT